MSDTSLTLGVIGGMGPAATVEFLGRVQAYTPAQKDQDHIRIIADINPKAPDRNVPGSNAGAVLAEMAGALAGAGAQVLAMPCNTAHAHADVIQRASGLPLIDMIESAAAEAQEAGVQRVGVLGTKLALRLYHEHLAARGLSAVFLSPNRQGSFMETLHQIKAGDVGRAVRKDMIGLAKDLVAEGAGVIIAGCTEVPLVMGPTDAKVEMVDPGELLARRCVAVCLGWEAAPQALPD